MLPNDVRSFTYDWNPELQIVTDYFTNSTKVEDIYKAIHVERNTKNPKFQMASAQVAAAFAGDDLIDYVSWIESLVNLPSPIFIYAGEFDEKDGPYSQEQWLKRLEFDD